ncbi:hypothetical protein PHMEG_0009946 [Phytophthora megakarya]|uniref:Uncharacterized protein n=1 Tax=Phytophthora megakarya TaxID=4795 RepID=A0A225WFI2_9STRA|nr:hypothetical protein PHMEG_0009946 [Phytophthora megakarya]
MTADEQQVFSAYMKGDLDFPASPTFLTCTTTTLKRAGMLAYHQRHIEVTLIANVGSNLQVCKYLKKKSILRELHTANGGTAQDSLMMKRLMNSKTMGRSSLKFRAGALVLAGANATQVGIKPTPQLAQHYAINVVGVTGLDLFTILTVFNSIAVNHVMDIRQRGLDGLNEADNDYWTVFFSDLDCPSMLRGVTCIIAKDAEMTIHNFKREPLAPCIRCLNPKHHHSRCNVSPQMLPNVRAN